MKSKIIYICSKCGYESPKWMGKCPDCNAWNSFEEEERVVQNKKVTASTTTTIGKRKVEIKKLSDVTSSNSDRIVTDISEFNRVVGGGLVKDSVTIITARPGAGKSTLLLQVADDLAKKGLKILYASGEESDSQIKNRAERILKNINPNIWVISDTSMNNVLGAIDEIDPNLVIIDSIQTFSLEEYNSRPGSPTQTMECANELVKIAKNKEKPRAVIMVGQMTKDDEIAGVRALEHLVDTVLIIGGESGEELRSLLASKNRFGSTGEMGFFSMTEEGMIPIDNPSQYFMTKRDDEDGISGSSLTVIKEGTRPIIAEVESLVSNSFMPYPSRISENLRREQLNTLISILEQRGGVSLYNKNVVVKTTGGLKLTEPSANLSILMSIVSSLNNSTIPNDTIFIADVGLTGELKKVPALETRLREVSRMGFKRVYIARGAVKDKTKFEGVNIIEAKTLQQVIYNLFGKLDFE